MIYSVDEASSAHLWLMSDIIDIVKPSINLPSQLLHAALHREESYEHDTEKLLLRKSRGEYKWARGMVYNRHMALLCTHL